GTDGSVTTLEDTAKTLGAGDFGFTDPNDTPANTLAAVEITTLPGAGSLKDNGVAVSAGQFVSFADITANKLVFTPATNANGSPYTTFTFQVQDNGGTANGGVDTDQSANTLTVNVTSVNDAPVLADKSPTLGSLPEDTPAPSGPVGALVSTLVDLNQPVGGLDNVTDVDASPLTGIAITARDNASGSWF